jgi:hypothetical protein
MVSARSNGGREQLAVLGAGLECGVHLLEAEFGLIERAPEEADEDATEPLCLSEAGASLVEGLDVEDVLAIEDAGDEEAAEPAKLALGLDSQNGRLEGHSPSAGGLDAHFECGSFAQFACEARHERIPLRVGPGVGEDGPDGGGRRVNVDLAAQFAHGLCLESRPA